MRKQKSSHQLTPSLNAQPAALKDRRGPWLQALLHPGTGKQHQVTVGAVAATTTRTPAANAARRSRLNRSPTTWLASCRRALSLSATLSLYRWPAPRGLHVHACMHAARARARTHPISPHVGSGFHSRFGALTVYPQHNWAYFAAF